MLAEAVPASKEAKDPTVELRTVPSLRSDLRSLIKWTRVGGSWIKRTDNKSWLEGTCGRVRDWERGLSEQGVAPIWHSCIYNLIHMFLQPDMQNKTYVYIQQYIFTTRYLDMLQRIFIYNTAPLLIVHPAVQHAFKW